jgi:excisionase family DNA binding protein
VPDEQHRPAEEPDVLLTVDEVASLLRLNPQTIRNMIDRRELGSVRLGHRRVRIRQSQLAELLAAGEWPARAVLHEAENEGGPWQSVRTALEAAIRAVNAEDQEALGGALSELVAAVQEARE